MTRCEGANHHDHVTRTAEEIEEIDRLNAIDLAANPPALSEAGAADTRAVLTDALAAVDADTFSDAHHQAIYDLTDRLDLAVSWRRRSTLSASNERAARLRDGEIDTAELIAIVPPA